MLTVISPAKRLDMKPDAGKIVPSQPAFQDDAVSLCITARRLSVVKLQKLMGISKALAKTNQDRFKAFDAQPGSDATKPAALMFAGDTYLGLEAGTLDAEEMTYAQDHLRILSGLYGLLRPMDLIQPYRLEMGSRLATRRGKSLYQYWGRRLALSLNALGESAGTNILVNCASQEYFGAVDLKALKMDVVTPSFLDIKDGKAAMIGFFAKKARGAMARFIVQNRIESVDGLRDFNTGGYEFAAAQSAGGKMVFTRPQPDPVTPVRAKASQ